MDAARWREFAERALGQIGKSGASATIAFVSDRAMRRLNRDFRGRDAATDVLSFPHEPDKFEQAAENDLGDVVISVERAAAQAAGNGLDFELEVAQLILHGLLHLCGYDHETDDGAMDRLELKLRRRLGIY
jgi:probable rRNA maturation factor